MSKYTPVEALRKSIDRPQTEAIAELSDEDKQSYLKLIDGNAALVKAIRRAKIGTAYYDAANYVLTDFMDLMDVVQRYEDPVAGSLQKPSPQVSPQSTALPGLPGKKKISAAPASAAPNPTPVATSLQDVIDKITEWQKKYGPLKGEWQSETIKASLSKFSKPLLSCLMDLGVFRVDSYYDMQYQKPGKVYTRKEDYDVKTVPWFGLLMQNGCAEQLELLFEHDEGKKMWVAASPDLYTHMVKMAFDTQNNDLLQKIVGSGIELSTLRDYDSGTPLMCDLMYRTEAEDFDNLELLVKHGASLTELDMLQSTPLMVAARVGNQDAMQFLLKHLDKQDLYAVNTMKESVLTLAEKGPEKRLQAQEAYDCAVEDAMQRYEESLQAWEVQTAAAEAAGKNAPARPKEPQFKPRPEDYPLEIIALVKNAWEQGDPSASPQKLAISKMNEPDEFAMEFDVNF